MRGSDTGLKRSGLETELHRHLNRRAVAPKSSAEITPWFELPMVLAGAANCG